MTVITRAARRFGARDGQALVEFALVVPLLLLLVLGIVDFGRAYNYKNDITSLANQAARLAEVNACSACTPQKTIDQYIEGTADSSELRNGGGQISTPLAISFCFPSTNNPNPGTVGSSLQITASATYNWLPFLVMSICLAISALYELIEWRIALLSGGAADDFLGTQGDVWDTQEDMCVALIGAACALLFFSAIHNRALRKLEPAG